MNNTERTPERPTMLRKLSSDELAILSELDAAARDMSFYNAAEGAQYYEEGAARYKAAQRLSKAREEAAKIGFSLGGGYLC